MASMLDQLKLRMEAAKQRVIDAEEELALAKVEFEVWSGAVELESGPRNVKQTPSREASIGEKSAPDNPRVGSTASLIRALIQEHPNGIKPIQLLAKLQGKLRSPGYLYAVLKRLRDDGLVVVMEDGRHIMKTEKGTAEAVPLSVIN